MDLMIKPFIKDVKNLRFKNILKYPWHILLIAVISAFLHNFLEVYGVINNIWIFEFIGAIAFFLTLFLIPVFLISLYKKNVYIFLTAIVALALFFNII